MSQPIDLEQGWELKPTDGSTPVVLVSAEQLTQLKTENERLREQLTAQQQRLSELAQDNERLLEETRKLTGERDGFYRWYLDEVKKEWERHPEELEAELLEGMKDAVDMEVLVRELEAELEQKRTEQRDVG